jgi:hypothetical protein
MTINSQMLSLGSGSGTSTRPPVYRGSEIGIFAVAVGGRGAGWAAASLAFGVVFVLAVLCVCGSTICVLVLLSMCVWTLAMSLTKGVSS